MILAIIQARMGSSRFPGKVMAPVLGRPMLERQIERIRRCEKIDQIVVATSNSPKDNVLEALCKRIGIDCFRGNLENVLDRFYQAAKSLKPQQVIRLTGDCPLIDPVFIDELVEFYLEGRFDYASNCLKPTLPDGLDAEIFSYAVLEEVWKEAELPSHLEHVTPYIHAYHERYKIGNYQYKSDFSNLRWTVDEQEDIEFVRKVYGKLYPLNPNFRFADIIELLEKEPELSRINWKYKRNEGLKKSLEKDKYLQT